MKTAGAVLLTLVVCSAAFAQQLFLSTSDIHFDPYADPAIFTKLEAADVSQWDAIFASSTVKTFSPHGQDTNDPLFRSALDAMEKQFVFPPAFVLISGDFLAHDFNTTYQQYATDKSQAAYSAFVTKTITYIASKFREKFPNVRIYPTLGNNDTDCGDYDIAPNGPFLASFRDVWKDVVQSKSFDERFATGGYYHADLPGVAVRLIALNANFFSVNYKNTCGKAGGPDPGMQELAWLDAELRLAKAEGKRVWLLFHIPPGMNVFNTVEAGGSCPTPQTFWKDTYATRYLAIVNKHRSTISGTFAGHTHEDEFRIVAGNFIHQTASVSPLFGNNPSFEIMGVDANGRIAGYAKWSLPDVTLPWSREYTFAQAYGASSYSTATLTKLAASINSDPATRTKYFDYYTSGSAKSSQQTLEAWKAYWCGITAMSGDAFTKCYCPQDR